MLQRVVNHAAGGVFFTQCYGVFEVKHQGISRVDEGVADHRGIGTRHKQHAAAGASFTLLQRSGNHWQSSHGRAGIPLARASRASSRARKMPVQCAFVIDIQLYAAHVVAGENVQNGGANCIAKLFLNAAIDLQVDILRIEWGDAYHHIPRLKGACNGGLVYFHFSPVSHAGVF
ncbi:Uncharacterised protein [Escherichia coli]|nr:Uncharacterised protein [Escherichia coli]